MSEIWLLSDSHYYHANIIRYCARPFADENEMNLEMERRWNSVVAPDDIVVYVGDLSAGLKGRTTEFQALIGRLNGRKVLVRGNHDHQRDTFYLEGGFRHVVNHLIFGGILFTHVPGTQNTEHPHPLADATRELQRVHKPALTIHGHVHSLGPEIEGHFNCAADRHAYTPFTLRSALERTGLSGRIDDVYNAIETYVGP